MFIFKSQSHIIQVSTTLQHSSIKINNQVLSSKYCKDNPSLYSRWSYYGDVTQKLSVTFSFFAWNVLHIGWMGRTELHVVLVIFLTECWTLFVQWIRQSWFIFVVFTWKYWDGLILIICKISDKIVCFFAAFIFTICLWCIACPIHYGWYILWEE